MVHLHRVKYYSHNDDAFYMINTPHRKIQPYPSPQGCAPPIGGVVDDRVGVLAPLQHPQTDTVAPETMLYIPAVLQPFQLPRTQGHMAKQMS